MQLCELLQQHKEDVKAYIHPDHANSHGICKGSGTHASTGTIAPPPVSSIATLGKVLDVYWHFSKPGDSYLGRVLAFLCPNSSDFAVLPPHFNVDNPMSNDIIREAMFLSFGPILRREARHEDTRVDSTGLLLRCLAALVHHSPFLTDMVLKCPGHLFAALPLLHHNNQIMTELKKLVTLEPIGQVRQAMGVPPHIQQAELTMKVLETCVTTFQEVKKMTKSVKEAVCEAIEQKAIENGHMTFDHLKAMFDEHSNNVDKKLKIFRIR